MPTVTYRTNTGFELTEKLSDSQYLHYLECMDGKDDGHAQFALMLAKRRPPQAYTDTMIFGGEFTGNPLENIPAIHRPMALAKAKAAGVSIQGKRYMGGAGKDYDPEWWVDSRADLKRLCEKHQLGCSGIVDIPTPPPTEGPRETYEVAQGLLEERWQDEMQTNPEVHFAPKKKQRQMKEALKERMSGDTRKMSGPTESLESTLGKVLS